MLNRPEDLEWPLETEGEAPLDWAALFGRPAPCAIEIGTGNGYFLASEAARLPDWNFLGVERDREFYGKMVRRCWRDGLVNVRATRMDALELLQTRIPGCSVERIYLHFSDPWPKRKHARRRVFGQPFLALAERALAPGGEIRFKTDVGWYFNLAITEVRLSSAWTLKTPVRQPPPDEARGEVYSNFERKAREQGTEVWGFTAVLEPSPATN